MRGSQVMSAVSTRCVTSAMSVVVIGSKTRSASPAPNVGRITRSPGDGAEDDQHRLPDVVVVPGHRDVAVGRGEHREVPADAEERAVG